jgi:hypothetical protein
MRWRASSTSPMAIPYRGSAGEQRDMLIVKSGVSWDLARHSHSFDEDHEEIEGARAKFDRHAVG